MKSSTDGARATALKTLHRLAPLYFLWLDYVIVTTASTIVMAFWERLGFPMIMLGLHLFTVWGQVLQQTYYFNMAWKEVKSSFTTRESYHTAKSADYMKHTYFPTVVFPITAVVTVNFWTVYMINPLLLDDLGVIDGYIPFWFNHLLHTCIFVISLAETTLNPDLLFPKEFSMAACKVLVIYGIACTVLEKICPRCVYKMFKDFTWWQSAAYLFVNIGLAIASYEAGKHLHRIIWGKRKVTNQHANGLKRT